MLEQIIEEAIALKGYINIPKVGLLVAHHHPASISIGEQKATPPSKSIVFSKKNYNDVYLRNQLCQKSGLDVLVAEEEVRAYAEQILHKLDLGRNVPIGRLGYLYKNNANEIEFAQNQQYNWNLESFGLPVVPCVPLAMLQREKAKKDAIIIELGKKNAKGQKKQITKQASIWGRLIPYAAVISALSLTAILVYWLNKSSFRAIDVQEQPATLVPALQLTQKAEPVERKSVPNATTGADTDINNAANLPNVEQVTTNPHSAAAITQAATDVENTVSHASTKPAEQLIAESTDMKYAVISGSFGLRANAEALKLEHKKQGYDAEVLKADDRKMYRVSVGKFISKDEALEFIKQHEGDFAEKLWVLAM